MYQKGRDQYIKYGYICISQCSGPPRVTLDLTNGGGLVGLLQHPFLPGVKGSDTACRKVRGSLGRR
jgi:hypothetical protein